MFNNNDTSRRGSVLSDSGSEDLEKKKMRAVLEMMGMKKQQKQFTWDTNFKKQEEQESKPSRRYKTFRNSLITRNYVPNFSQSYIIIYKHNMLEIF